MDYRPRPEDHRFILNAVLDAPSALRALAPFAEAVSYTHLTLPTNREV